MYPEILPDDPRYHYTAAEIFKHPLDTTHAFVKDNYHIGMHEQEFFEINIITEGHGCHYIESHHLPVTRGDVFILPPRVPHGYASDGGLGVFHLLLSDRFMRKNVADLQMLPSFYALFRAEPLMRAGGRAPYHLSLNDDGFEQAKRVILALLPFHDLFNAEDAIVRESLSMVLITLLCRMYAKSTITDGHPGDQAFMNALSQIHKCYGEKLTVDMLAATACLSRSAFISKFTAICKMPPSTYLMAIRLESAAYMLDNTSYSLSEIAERCGFYDTAHLSRSFHAKTGLTPTQYRHQNKSR